MMTFITENTFLAQITTYCRSSSELMREGLLQFCPCGALAMFGYPCRGCGAVSLTLADGKLGADIQVRPAISRIINLDVSDEPLRS